MNKIFKKNEKPKPEVLFSYLLGLFIEKIGIWSRDGLVCLANNLFGMVEETFDTFTKRYSNMKNYFLLNVDKKGREEILGWMFNNQLAAEKLSLLSGFGFTNRFGDSIKGNPEYQSIYDGYTGYREQT